MSHLDIVHSHPAFCGSAITPSKQQVSNDFQWF